MKALEWLNNQFEWLKSIFSEDGKGSFRRITSFMVIVLFIRNYSMLTIRSTDSKLAEIPETWVLVLLVLIGYSSVLSMTKIFNKDKGNSNESL